MRQRKAVRLGLVQFAIFYALHKRRPAHSLPSTKLCDEIYDGVRNPSTLQTLRVCITNMNRKLEHLGVKIQGNNHRQNSFYQIVTL
jgi:hypothetical protein